MRRSVRFAKCIGYAGRAGAPDVPKYAIGYKIPPSDTNSDEGGIF